MFILWHIICFGFSTIRFRFFDYSISDFYGLSETPNFQFFNFCTFQFSIFFCHCRKWDPFRPNLCWSLMFNLWELTPINWLTDYFALIMIVIFWYSKIKPVDDQLRIITQITSKFIEIWNDPKKCEFYHCATSLLQKQRISSTFCLFQDCTRN